MIYTEERMEANHHQYATADLPELLNANNRNRCAGGSEA